MGLRPLEIFVLLQCADRLWASESDVYRRQILTTKVDPRTVKTATELKESKLKCPGKSSHVKIFIRVVFCSSCCEDKRAAKKRPSIYTGIRVEWSEIKPKSHSIHMSLSLGK